jgi:hypothetical protein
MNSESQAPTEEVVTRPYGKIILSLDNVLFPAEKTETSPSREDGLDEKSERELRFIGCELIQTAGILLKVPQVLLFAPFLGMKNMSQAHSTSVVRDRIQKNLEMGYRLTIRPFGCLMMM